MVYKKNKQGGTRKMKGGTKEMQGKVLHILSTLLALSSLGYLTWCAVLPIVKQLLDWLQEYGVNSVTLSFYELLWDNLTSTWHSMADTMSQTTAAAASAMQTFSKAGNACAIGHAGIRLASPLYHFFLEFIKQIATIMQDPYQLNQSIQQIVTQIATIINTFVDDYSRVGAHAIKGLDKTSGLINELYAKMSIFSSKAKESVLAKIPSPSAAEVAAEKKNIEIFSKYVKMINSILTMAVSTGAAAASSAKPVVGSTMDWCTASINKPAEYAKSFMSFFKRTLKTERNLDMNDFVVPARARTLSGSPSPPPSPPPSKKDLNSLMMALKSTPEPSGSAMSLRKRSATPALNIIPTPNQIAKCSTRAQTEPLSSTYGAMPGKQPRFVSMQPGLQAPAAGPIRFSKNLAAIPEGSREESPFAMGERSPSPQPVGKAKIDGGKRKRSRRHTKKHIRYGKRRTARMVRRR